MSLQERTEEPASKDAVLKENCRLSFSQKKSIFKRDLLAILNDGRPPLSKRAGSAALVSLLFQSKEGKNVSCEQD
jgi:hypothetical protein